MSKENILDYGRYINPADYRYAMQSTRMDDEAKLLRELEKKNILMMKYANYSEVLN